MQITELTKEQWLKRCETVYNKATSQPFQVKIDLELLDRVVDALLRLEGGQLGYWLDFMESERKRTDNFSSIKTLANDEQLYGLMQAVAILSHPCQICAEDKEAWHTRRGFCNHNK